MRVDKRRPAAYHVHTIARQLVGDDCPLTRYDFVYAGEQLRRRRPSHGNGAAAIRAGSGGEVQDRLAKGLAGDRAGGKAGSPERAPTFDQEDALTQLRRLHSAPLACRAAADADQVVVKGVAQELPR